MPVPGEHYVLRTSQIESGHFEHTLLDLAYIGAGEAVALIEWKSSPFATPIPHSAGFAIIRFNLRGDVVWQIPRTLCSLNVLECGDWAIEGHLARTPDGFIAAMTGTNINNFSRAPIMFAVRVDDLGKVLWQRTYKAGGALGKIASIAPMKSEDRYLIAANSNTQEAWLWEIDGTGVVKNAVRQPNLFVRRLRALPSQGICAVGEIIRHEDGATNAAVLNIDPTSLTANWFRRYTIGGEGFGRSLRWIDIAEGTQSLLVVGNVLNETTESIPVMAFLNTTRAAPPAAGFVRFAHEPQRAEDPVRLRGVASYFEKSPDATEETARYTVAGSAAGYPWQFIVQEDGTIEWQKRYRKIARDTGHIGPTQWPSFDYILAGGTVTEGSRSHAILTASPSKIGRGIHTCADESDVKFPDKTVASHAVTPQFLPWAVLEGECWIGEAPLLKIRKDCLDLQ